MPLSIGSLRIQMLEMSLVVVVGAEKCAGQRQDGASAVARELSTST